MRAGLDRSSERRYTFFIDGTRLKVDSIIGGIFQHHLIVEETSRFDRLWNDQVHHQGPNSSRSRHWRRHWYKSRNDTVPAEVEAEIREIESPPRKSQFH